MGVWISSSSALLQFISVDDVDIAWCISDYRHPKFGMQIVQLHQAKLGHCVKWWPSTPQVYWHIDIDITFANIVTCACVHHVMMSCHVMMVSLCVQVFGKMPGAPRTSTQSPEKSLHMHGETTLLGTGTVHCGHEAPSGRNLKGITVGTLLKRRPSQRNR